jgi:integrase
MQHRPAEIAFDGEWYSMTVNKRRARVLPDQVLRFLHEALPRLESHGTSEARVATEVLMDTGRRLHDVLELPLDCLDRDEDGGFVLSYWTDKSHRRNRRLPITAATAAVIAAQQDAVLSRFPTTDRAFLTLLPAPRSNPKGWRSLREVDFRRAHERWTRSLLPAVLPDGTLVDRANVGPTAYRHSYAQRLADLGVPIDMLADLMDHESVRTTQQYHRVADS